MRFIIFRKDTTRTITKPEKIVYVERPPRPSRPRTSTPSTNGTLWADVLAVLFIFLVCLGGCAGLIFGGLALDMPLVVVAGVILGIVVIFFGIMETINALIH